MSSRGRPHNWLEGRVNHYYRKIFMQRYIENAPRRGLGRHRLPRLLPRLGRQSGAAQEEPLARVIVLLAIATFSLICLLMCLATITVALR